MKSAEKLFKKLGYKKIEEHDDLCDYIQYISNDEYCDCITFFCDSKTFCIGEHFLYNIEILQAINKQIKELGWNK